MKRDTEFDCVQMKWEIQERHLREVEELGEEEAKQRRWQRVLDDPVLGAFVRAVPATPAAATAPPVCGPHGLRSRG
ncbi:MAG: hypothetical protein ABSE56_18185 [Bryobacteraceae bacterium]